MTPRLRYALRLAAIVAATLFFGTALIAPQWNPLLAGWVVTRPQTAAWMAQGWSEVNLVRLHIHEYVLDNDEWPASLDALPVPLQGQVFDFSIAEPYVLVATVRDDPRVERAVRGGRVTFRYGQNGLQWQCSPGDPPLLSRYLPMNCRSDGDNSTDLTRWLFSLIVMGVLILLAAGLLLVWRHPLLAPVQRDPARLRRMPLHLLPRLDAALGWLRRRRDTLAAAGVSAADWKQALAFAALTDDRRADLLALRVAARSSASSGWNLPGRVYEWTFSGDMPVSLERCLLWLVPAQAEGEQLVRHLRQAQTGLDVLLIAGADAAAEAALRRLCADRANLYVCLDQETLTGLLLQREPLGLLLAQLARQLRLSRISPYQTRGGVARASGFFGRESLLARVVQREPSNYLLVGGRQLGKTSLMKAIERRLRDHPRLACIYVVLRDHRLLPRLAAQSGLPLDSDLSTIVAELVRQQGGKRLLLLIDEADPFFRADAARDYAELAALRALSEEGHCHFLLAGFWDLYAAVALDYQSPLRNFGEVISVGGLEEEACRELATVPLGVLNLRFADPALVGRIVEQSGRRANLVAILCQECLDGLDGGGVIEAADVEQALRSQAVLDALAGWGRLSHDDLASRLDRIAVYRVAAQGVTSLADMVALLRPHAAIDVEAIRRAFSRLQLAYVFARRAEQLHFAVPLFARQFEAAEVPVLLAEELAALGTAGGSKKP